MEKKFEDDELDKLLEEQFMKEADMIEEALFSDENFEDFEETDEEVRAAYDKLVARLKVDGIYREDDDNDAEKKSSSASSSDEVAAEIGDRAETISAQSTGSQEHESKVIPMRGEEGGEKTGSKKRKVFSNAGMVAAIIAICLIFTSVSSEATRSFFIKKINYLTGNDTRIVVGNNERSDVLEIDETKAANKIKDEIGVKVPSFTYRPNNFEFYAYEVDSSAGFALLEYRYNKATISMHIDKNKIYSESNMFSLHGQQITTINLVEDNIQIKVLEIQDSQDMEASFAAYWTLDGVYYQISGKMKKDEFINLIEKMKY